MLRYDYSFVSKFAVKCFEKHNDRKLLFVKRQFSSSFWKFENTPGPISSQPNSFGEQQMTDDRCRQIPPSPSVEMQKQDFSY